MELQKNLPNFERAGVALFAVSYDSVDILAAFAAKYGITYPLLSDEGSQVIRRLGLLNEHVAEQSAHYGVQVREQHFGVPYPGTFVLDESGVIVEKLFEQSYRVRPAAVSFLEDSFGLSGSAAVRAEVATPELRVAAWSGTSSYRPYQKLKLHIDIEIAPGLHVYGLPVPEGYSPLQIALDPLETLEAGALELPEPRPFRLEGLEESFHIYEGAVRGALPLMLLKNLGDITPSLRVRYQACSAVECFPPAEVSLRLPLIGLDNLRD